MSATELFEEKYVNPKVELAEKDYRKLVETANLKKTKIKKLAEEYYLENGAIKVNFYCSIQKKNHYEEHSPYEFSCDVRHYNVTPSSSDPISGEPLMPFFSEETRKKIASKVRNYVTETFSGCFGEHMLNINKAIELRKEQERNKTLFMTFTLSGWLLALLILCVSIFK